MENLDDLYPITHEIKLIIIGNSGVGKSVYTHRCKSPSYVFNDSTKPTIGIDFSVRVVPHPTDTKARVRLYVWDTAGQERFDALVRGYFRKVAGVIFVYDLTSPESFADIKRRWVPTVLNGMQMARDKDGAPLVSRDANDDDEPEAPMFESILIGNKSDLVEPTGRIPRAVSYEQANDFATNELGIPYVECSCKDDAYEKLTTPVDWLVSLVLANRRLAARVFIPLASRPEQHGGTLKVKDSNGQSSTKSDGGCCS